MIKKKDDLYHQSFVKQPIEAKFPSKGELRAYAKGNYKEIFPEYDKDKHKVERINYGVDGNILRLINRNEVKGESVPIPPGMYEFTYKEFEVYFREYELPKRNDYIEINNGMDKFTEHINEFFNMEEEYKKNDEPYTDSSLLYGEPGTGKTFSIMHNVDKLLKDNEIRCFYIPGHIKRLDEVIRFGEDLDQFNKILIIEEIEERSGSGIETLVNFLDGYTKWGNTYTIGTTNHPSSLPKKLVKRPGRFNTLIEAKLPGEKEIRKFFKEKGLEFNKEHIFDCDRKEMSYAHLNEITKLVKIKGMSISKAIEKLKNHNERVDRNFESEDKQIGLGRDQ